MQTVWILLMIAIIGLCAKPTWQRYIIYRWKKSLALKQHLSVYKKIITDIDGFYLSRQARTDNDTMEYVYGEIDALSFIALLSLTKPDNNTVFYDLGSGVGKTVLLSTMVFNIKKGYGVECFAQLHDASITLLKRLQCIQPYETIAKRILFIQDDIFHHSYDDATHIFINSTAFFGDRWLEISQKLAQLTQCKTIITTSKKLLTDVYTVCTITKVQMSWGVVQAFIHKRQE